MLMYIEDGRSIQIGSVLVQHILNEEDSYFCRGDVISVIDNTVDVDFGDTITRFDLVDISYMFDTRNLEESFVTIEKGVVINEYR